MTITGIEPLNQKKYKIFINYEFAFVLYKGELRRYGIAKMSEIADETYYEIVNEILVKRAKARALYLLSSVDRTEQQLREKLRQNYYPEEAIDMAVAYVVSYGYINDTDYARRYFLSKGNTKSRRAIEMELVNKGISKEIIASIGKEAEINEHEIILNAIHKKCKDIQGLNQKERQKLYGFLLRKGFAYEDINYAFRQISDKL